MNPCVRYAPSAHEAPRQRVLVAPGDHEHERQPTLDAPIETWLAHVLHLSHLLAQATSADEVACSEDALIRAGQRYAQRPFASVRDEASLLANRSLAVDFARYGCQAAVLKLAEEFAGLDVRLSEFDAVSPDLLSDLAWAFGHADATDPHVGRALRELTDEACHRLRGDANYFSVEQTRDLLSGLNRSDPAQAEAILWLERTVHQARPRQSYQEKRRKTEHPDCANRDASSDRGKDNSLSAMSGKQLSWHARDLGRQPQDWANRRGMEALVTFLLEVGETDARLTRYSWRDLAGLANGLSKFVNESRAGEGLPALAIAICLRDEADGPVQASGVKVSLLVSALSKRAGVSGDKECNEALSRLAREVSRRDLGERQFNSIALTSLVNGVSKRAGESGDKDCNGALSWVARGV